MFYAQFVLAKKGPLARIWLAAHWDKKLTKAHVFETNIEKSVDGILQPRVKMALRTSGHLLLGVVRIYSRKAKYLLADCNEAFVKIKMAFRPGMVDLPEDIREAAVSAITLPEVFHDFDTPIADLNEVDIQAQFSLNQSRAEEITMREDYGNMSLVAADDGFGDMGFEGTPELIRAASAMEQSLGHQTLMFGESGLEKDKEEPSTSKIEDSQLGPGRVNSSALDLEAPIRDDGFGGNIGQDMIPGGLFDGGLFDDTPMVDAPSLDGGTGHDDHPMNDAVPSMLDQTQAGGLGTGVEPMEVDGHEPRERVGASTGEDVKTEDSDDDGNDLDRFGGPPSVSPPSSPEARSRPTSPVGGAGPDAAVAGGSDSAPSATGDDAHREGDGSLAQDQTTLLQNVEETFALAPVDASAIRHGWPRAKRKRKLIVDEVKNISGEEMKAQLSDTSDIVNTLDLAPPTKRLMHWKETGGVEKLFALPGRPISARLLSKMYQRHLTSVATQNEDFGMAGDKELENLSLEQVRDGDDGDGPPEKSAPKTRGRPKRKQPDHKDSDDDREEMSRTRKSRHSEPDDIDHHMDEPLMSPPGIAPLTPAPASGVASETPGDVSLATEDRAARPSTEESFNQLMADHQAEAGVGDDIEEVPLPGPASPPPADTSMNGPVETPMDVENHADSGPEVIDLHQEPVPDPAIMEAMRPSSPHPTLIPPPSSNALCALPSSPGHPEEEQAEDETYEEFEERVVNKRAAQTFKQIKRSLRTETLAFSEMTASLNRKQVARTFYTMLVLKKLQAVELQQTGCFQELYVSRGNLFDKAKI